MRLLLAPHAPTDWNAQGRYQGWTDTPLSEIGWQQAALLARRLLKERIDACYASDRRRAGETAATIAEARNLTVTQDPRLREMNFGAWEGLTYGEICQADRPSLLAWEADPMQVAPPDGETLGQVAGRVASFLEAVAEIGAAAQDSHCRTLLVVAHRGSLRVLLCLSLRLPPSAWWQFHLTPASVSELLCFPEGAVLNFLNDTHHLREVADAG